MNHIVELANTHMLSWGLIYKTVCKIHTQSLHVHKRQKSKIPKNKQIL